MKTKFLAPKKIKIQMKFNHRIRLCFSDLFFNLEQCCLNIVIGIVEKV